MGAASVNDVTGECREWVIAKYEAALKAHTVAVERRDTAKAAELKQHAEQWFRCQAASKIGSIIRLGAAGRHQAGVGVRPAP